MTQRIQAECGRCGRQASSGIVDGLCIAVGACTRRAVKAGRMEPPAPDVARVIPQRDSRIFASIASGDRAALEALRDRLAVEMDSTVAPRILAALGRQFISVITTLSEMKKPAGSRVDEIARRRAARRAAVRGE